MSVEVRAELDMVMGNGEVRRLYFDLFLIANTSFYRSDTLDG
jgi:hypothetical protein